MSTTESSDAREGLGLAGRGVGTERSGALSTFQQELGGMWESVSHLCLQLDDEGVGELSLRLERHMHAHPACQERVGELANDLLALMAGWQHFGPEERAVLVGAMTYLAEGEDQVPDHLPGGLEDDDRVVGAAVRAILRPRRSAA